MRGLLTATKLLVWYDDKPHAEVEHDEMIQGIRLLLGDSNVQVNHETVAMPEYFPWVLPKDAEMLDMDDRRRLVEDYLAVSDHLRQFYPTGFHIGWYY